MVNKCMYVCKVFKYNFHQALEKPMKIKLTPKLCVVRIIVSTDSDQIQIRQGFTIIKM